MSKVTTIEQGQPAAPAADVPGEGQTLMQMIERASRDPAVDIDKMRELLAMRKQIIAEANEQKFWDAMARAQGEMQAVVADAHNPQTRSKYASYRALDETVRPIYSKNGFALSFDTEDGAPPNHIRVVCLVSCAGHTRKYHRDMPADGKGAKGGDVMTLTHAGGAASTYGQRYLLIGIFNLAIDRDTDGNAPPQAQGPISAEQLKELTTLIAATGAIEANVLGHVSKKANTEITALGQIPAHLFGGVMLSIKNWGGQQMITEVFTFEQGSPEWYAARLGIPTASEFKTILGIKKDARDKLTRQSYMRKLAGEVLTGKPMEHYTNPVMDRGTELETEARDEYAFATGTEPQRVGFIRYGQCGCSPDSLIGERGGLEIKCVLPHTQIERLQAGVLPPEYVAQVQGSIWVAARLWWDFVSYCPGLPLFVVRVKPDPGYIKMVAEGVDAFNTELADMVAFVRNYSGRKAA